MILSTFVITGFLALAADKDTVLWEHQFLYFVQGQVKGGYSEKLTKRMAQKHLAIEQNWKELSGGGVSETFIGSVVKDDSSLAPVAFFSERSGSTSYKVDGRALKNELVTTFKPQEPKGPSLRKVVKLSKNLHLSNFITLVFARSVGNAESLSFKAIAEDPQDKNLDPRSLTAKIFPQKKLVLGAECRLAVVTIDGTEGKWWFAADGSLCEMEIPSAQTRLVRATKEEAKKAGL